MRRLTVLLVLCSVGVACLQANAPVGPPGGMSDIGFPEPPSDASEARNTPYQWTGSSWYNRSEGWRSVPEFDALGTPCKLEMLENPEAIPLEQFQSFGSYARMTPGIHFKMERGILDAVSVAGDMVPAVTLFQAHLEPQGYGKSSEVVAYLVSAVRLDTGQTVLAYRLTLAEYSVDGTLIRHSAGSIPPRNSAGGFGIGCNDRVIKGLIDYASGTMAWSQSMAWSGTYTAFTKHYRTTPPEIIFARTAIARFPIGVPEEEIIVVEPRWVMFPTAIAIDGTRMTWARFPDDETVIDMSDIWMMEGTGPKTKLGVTRDMTCIMAAADGVTVGFAGMNPGGCWEAQMTDPHFWVRDASGIIREGPTVTEGTASCPMLRTDGVYGAAGLGIIDPEQKSQAKIVVWRLSDWMAREIPAPQDAPPIIATLTVIGGFVSVGHGKYGRLEQVLRYSLDDFENLGVPFAWATGGD